MEFQEIELTPGETSAERAERLFKKRYHRSSDEALSLLKLERTQALQAVEALIETHQLSRYLIPARLEHYMIESVGRFAQLIASDASDADRYLRSPKASVLSLVELKLVWGGAYGIWADVVKWKLSPARVENAYLLNEYQQAMRNPEFRKTNEVRKRENIPLYTKPLCDLTDRDFFELFVSRQFSRQDFTSLVSTIAVFQAAQKAVEPKPQITVDDLLAEDRKEALSLIERLQAALENPDNLRAVIGNAQARAQLADIFNMLGMVRAGDNDRPAVNKPE